MGTRAYRRDSRGRFAGGGGGTRVTYGNAGGFANASFRGRVSASRGVSRPSSANRARLKSAGRVTSTQIRKVAKNKKVRRMVIGSAVRYGTRAAVGAVVLAAARKAALANGPRMLGPGLTAVKKRRGVYNITTMK